MRDVARASPPSAPARRRGGARRRRAIRRSGCGSSGNWCIGGSGAKTTWRTPAPGRAASRRARARCAARARIGTWSMTSLTPVTTTATSAGRRRRSRAAARALRGGQAGARAQRATRSRAGALRRQRAAPGGRRTASSWCATPTPAADESPAISRRSARPVAAPSVPVARARRPRAARGARRARASACATSSGASASLSASDSAGWQPARVGSELREVGLALLEEGLNASFASGLCSRAREELAFDARSSRSTRLARGAAHQPLGLAHGARRQRVEALGDAARVAAPPRPPAAPRWRCRTRPPPRR